MLNDPNSVTAQFYDGWEVYQQNLVKAIAPLTDEQLALTAGPGLRSVLNLIHHVISVRAGWYMGAGADAPDMMEFATWGDRDAPAHSAAELVRGLELTWKMMHDALAKWTPDDLQATFEDEGEYPTRKWMVWHVIEHDLHHGGEISYSLGMHGIRGIDI
jgi:uncharacterized damage-inducible protein DinB